MFTSFVEGSALFEPELLLRYSRMLGDAASRIAEGSVSLFVRTSPMIPSRGAPRKCEEDRALDGDPRVPRLGHQDIERMLLHHFVLAGERLASMRDGQHTVEAAVGFVDLTDSTGLVVDYGARAVEPALAAFEMTAADAAASRGGRLVKLIGDAAMFIAPDAESAVDATRRDRRAASAATTGCVARAVV